MLHVYTSYTKKQYAIYSIHTPPLFSDILILKKIKQQKVVKLVQRCNFIMKPLKILDF